MHIVLVLVLIAGVLIIRASSSSKNTRKIEAIYAGFLIFLFAALRGETVGIDLHTYAYSYSAIASWSLEGLLDDAAAFAWSSDPVFWIFIRMLTNISSDPQFMIVVLSAIVAVSVSLLIYRSKSDVLLCFLVFICLRYFSFTLSGLRQALAMSVLFFALTYLERKKYIPFMILALLASAFHASAFVIVVAFPIMLIKSTEFLVVFSLIFAIFTFAFSNFFSTFMSLIPFLNDRFGNYIEMLDTVEGSVMFGIYIVVLVFVLVQQKQIGVFIIKKTSRFRFRFRFKDNMHVSDNITTYINFLIVGTTISLIGMFVPNLFRIAYYFIIPSMLYLFPKTIEYYEISVEPLSLKTIVIVLLLTQYVIIGPGAGVDEYLFFWE